MELVVEDVLEGLLETSLLPEHPRYEVFHGHLFALEA